MDFCHGGSVIRLPYLYNTGDTNTQMYYDGSFDFSALIGLAIIGGVLVRVVTSGDGGHATGGGGGGDGTSDGGDDCCGDDCCCEAFFEGLFE